jgi:SHS2 domain-containing protein
LHPSPSPRGSNLEEAFEQSAAAMFHYITDLNAVEEQPAETLTLEVKGHDLISLLFNFLDECLFQFSAEGFCIRRVEILSLDQKVVLWGRGGGGGAPTHNYL